MEIVNRLGSDDSHSWPGSTIIAGLNLDLENVITYSRNILSGIVDSPDCGTHHDHGFVRRDVQLHSRRQKRCVNRDVQIQVHCDHFNSGEMRIRGSGSWFSLFGLLWICLIFFLTLVPTCNGQSQKIPVIIDTDPGVDDVLAMLLAIGSPEIEIIGIIVTYGNTDLDSAYNNTLKLYNALHNHLELYPDDKKRFPNFDTEKKPFLARGPSEPLQGGLRNKEYFDEGDGLGNIATFYPDITTGVGGSYFNISNKPGHEVALDLLRTYPSRSINYIALGPLTNLALAAREDPAVVRDRVGRVIIMGGALDVPGNSNPVAEYNFFNDPFAVKELLDADDNGIGPNSTQLPLDRVLLVPLDITELHNLFYPTYTALVDRKFIYGQDITRLEEKYPLTYFTSAFLQGDRVETIESGGSDSLELDDLVAMWCAITTPPQSDADARMSSSLGLQDGWEYNRRTFQVERLGEVTRGMLVVNRTTVSQGQQGQGLIVQITSPANLNTTTGVPTIIRTPGEGALVASMIARIWGCCLVF